MFCTECLVVKGDQLTASIPEDLWHVVAGVHTGTSGVDTTQLPLVVAGTQLRWKQRMGLHTIASLCTILLGRGLWGLSAVSLRFSSFSSKRIPD